MFELLTLTEAVSRHGRVARVVIATVSGPCIRVR